MGHAFLADMPQCDYCQPCVHYQYLYHNGSRDAPKVCLYILDTGHMRPCPAGEGCTERVTPQQFAETKQGAILVDQRACNSRGGKRTHTTWDQEADAQLVRLRAAGFSQKKIADRLGKTESAVSSRVGVLRKRGELQ